MFIHQCLQTQRVFTAKLPEVRALLVFVESEIQNDEILNSYFYFNCVERDSEDDSSLQVSRIPNQKPKLLPHQLLNIDNSDYVVSLVQKANRNTARSSRRERRPRTFRDYGGYEPDEFYQEHRDFPNSRNDGEHSLEQDEGGSPAEFNELILKVICHRRTRNGTIQLSLVPVKKFQIEPIDFGRDPVITYFVYAGDERTLVVQCGACYFRLIL